MNKSPLRRQPIRVDRSKEVRPGIWAWRVFGLALDGLSRQPLLDACRAIKLTGCVAGDEQIAIYRKGREQPDMWCPLCVGAAHTVKEDRSRPRFVKYRASDVDASDLREAAE